MKEIKIGIYVYDIGDIDGKNLLVLKIQCERIQVYCMRRNDKFWLNKSEVKLTPIWWKGETHD